MIEETLGEYLEYESFEDPVLFRMTYEGEPVMLPSFEMHLILKRYDFEWDQVGGGIGPDEKSWWSCAFDSKDVDPEEVISELQEMLDRYNTPPEDMDEQDKEQWEESVVKITEIEGL